MTTVEGRYFPATVMFPGGSTWARTYVIIARGGDYDGLHIWRQPGDVAEYRAGIDWGLTRIPPAWQARNGVTVHLTSNELITVTPGGGCRCGALARFAGPSWANTVRVTA